MLKFLDKYHTKQMGTSEVYIQSMICSFYFTRTTYSCYYSISASLSIHCVLIYSLFKRFCCFNFSPLTQSLKFDARKPPLASRSQFLSNSATDPSFLKNSIGFFTGFKKNFKRKSEGALYKHSFHSDSLRKHMVSFPSINELHQ